MAQHVTASCSVLKNPIIPVRSMWPSECCSVYFRGRLYDCVIQVKLLSLNNVVVVTNVLATVFRDTFAHVVGSVFFLYTSVMCFLSRLIQMIIFTFSTTPKSAMIAILQLMTFELILPDLDPLWFLLGHLLTLI